MEYKISIIVPVYNTSAFLRKCLDSLLGQTLSDIQIICINDGSQDASLSILKEYQQKDKRICVLDIQNQGVSNARNLGLEYASGEYIAFVDSDDWIDLDFCEKLYNTAQKESADVVMCTYMREYEQASLNTCIFEQEYFVLERDGLKEKIHRRLYGLIGEELKKPERIDSIASLWTQLIKTEIAKKIKFVDLNIIGTFEDGLYQIQLFDFCNCFVYINHPLYHYRKTNTQSITSKYKPKLFEQWQRLYNLLYEQIKDNNYGDIYYEALSNRIAIGLIGLGLNEIANKESSFLQKSKRLKEIIKTERYQKALKRLDIKNMPFKWKVFFRLCKYKQTGTLVILLNIIKILKGRV